MFVAQHPWLFPSCSALATLAVAGVAGAVRGRFYAIFATVLLTIHSLVASSMVGAFAAVWPAFFALHAVVYVHFTMLVWPRMRPTWYRLFVSMPASWFVAATFLAIPWAIAVAAGLPPKGAFIPYVLAAVGLVQSFRNGFEEIDVALDATPVTFLARYRSGAQRVTRPLRIAQITDPHLGPFMSEGRLRGVVERVVAADPDLVLLTGDFLTMESHSAEGALTRALSPLTALPGRVFACRGNHDFEAPETVARALSAAGARLLVDEAETVDTPAGKVQIVGIDFHFRERAARTRAVCEAHPRLEHHFRLVLLHDPGAFRHLPDGEADLVLSGHTHGGQLGLVSLGLPLTFLSVFTKIPDHGLWALGTNRLYVHRGTGHYGFPLRIGVPGEESLLRVHLRAGT